MEDCRNANCSHIRATMTAEAEKYNGWSNYETWCVNLWLTNEPGSESMLQEIVNGTEIGCGAPELNPRQREDNLQDFVTNHYQPWQGYGMFQDLLKSALDNVNWREIIENHQEKPPKTLDQIVEESQTNIFKGSS